MLFGTGCVLAQNRRLSLILTVRALFQGLPANVSVAAETILNYFEEKRINVCRITRLCILARYVENVGIFVVLGEPYQALKIGFCASVASSRGMFTGNPGRELEQLVLRERPVL